MDAVLRGILFKFRQPIIVALHAVLATVAYAGAYLIRFDFAVPTRGLHAELAPLFVACMLASLCYHGLFTGMWRYVTARDAAVIVRATTVGTLAFTAATVALPPAPPRSVLLLSWLLATALFAGVRLASRLFRERVQPQGAGARCLIVLGAGDAGARLAHEVATTDLGGAFRLVGFLDDDRTKVGMTIRGLSVLGTIEDLGPISRRLGVSEAVVAIPSASGQAMRRILTLCRAANVRPNTLPAVSDLLDGSVSLKQMREVAVEDLLKRSPVVLEESMIHGSLTSRRVLVTGAGGSIGSELCRQIAQRVPATLVLFERSEPALYQIHRELHGRFPALALVPVAGDVTDAACLAAVFGRERPEVVFHAAAYKHVPMMEWNVSAAVQNNVLGTQRVALASDRAGVDCFVQISTDKAVNPTSVMGCTKRVAELFVQELGHRSRTRFSTVRFGNVLGSAGSVVPLFREQIAKGGPVTITHPDMRRYFMTIPEACQLVLQAATMGKGGEIFVLNMGSPVRILDLARDMITLSGLTPHLDIPIVYTGLRPGEKLFEEILTSGESVSPTHHPAIVVAAPERQPWDDLLSSIQRLDVLSTSLDDQSVRAALSGVVREYRPLEQAHAAPTFVLDAIGAPVPDLGPREQIQVAG